MRIWDDTAGKLVYDYVGKATAAMAITNAPVVLGGLPLMSEYYDGLLDEVAVFNDVLTNGRDRPHPPGRLRRQQVIVIPGRPGALRAGRDIPKFEV